MAPRFLSLFFLLLLGCPGFGQDKPLVYNIDLYAIDSIGYHYASIIPTSNFLRGLSVGPDGRIYTLYDSLYNNIRQFILANDRHGTEELISDEVYLAGGAAATSPTVMILDEQANLYLVEFRSTDYQLGKLVKFNQAGEREEIADLPFSEAGGIARDQEGNFYISDFWNGGIYQVDPQNNVSLFASTETYASGLLYDPVNDKLISAELTGGSGFPTNVFAYSLATKEKSLMAVFPWDVRYLTNTPQGDLWGIHGENRGFIRFDSEGHAFEYDIPIALCNGLAVDPLGNILVTGDINEGGDIHQLTRTLFVNENLLLGDSLLKINLAKATSADRFSLVQGQEDRFTLGDSSGILTIANPRLLDYEGENRQIRLEVQFVRNWITTTEELFVELLDEQKPGVLTLQPDSVGAHAAILKGEVYDEEAAEVTQRGFVFSMQPNPTLADSILISGSGKGVFQASLMCLNQQLNYYVRAFATNAYGTSYGNEIVFNTLSNDAAIVMDKQWLNLENTMVGVNWSTEWEMEKVRFIVEKATADLQFNYLDDIEGIGCSPTGAAYGISDVYPDKGDNYYRLLHEEKNGKRVVHDTLHFFYAVPLAAKEGRTAGFKIFPNPVAGQFVVLQVPDDHIGRSFNFRLTDALGRQLFSIGHKVLREANATIKLPEQLRPGWYVLSLTGRKESYYFSLLIQAQ